MSAIEDRLGARLEGRVADIGVPFTAEHVRQGRGPRSVATTRRRRGRQLVGASALVVVIGVLGGAIAWRAADDGTSVTVTGDRPLRIVVDDQARPRQLAANSIVLDAEQVGAVEVGAPGPDLLQVEPGLVGATCVATRDVSACDVESTGSRFSTTQGRATGAIVGGLGPADALFLLEWTGTDGDVLVVSGLRSDVGRVDVVGGERGVWQQPEVGTIAVPVDPAARSLTVRASSADGAELWSETIELPDPNMMDPGR